MISYSDWNLSIEVIKVKNENLAIIQIYEDLLWEAYRSLYGILKGRRFKVMKDSSKYIDACIKKIFLKK